MKKTRIISMFLAVALVVSCFSVALAAAPVEFIFPGQKQELALGDWTGVIQSNPQNTPTVVENGYILISNRNHVHQGFTYTFDYLFEAGVEYTVSFDLNIVADENLRFYMHDAATDTAASELLSTNTKITSVDNKYRGGKLVSAGDSVITMSFTPAEDLSGVFTLKMHSNQTPPANNDIKIDNFKITNDSGKPEYVCDFNSAEDAAGVVAYVYSGSASAGKPDVPLEGLSAAAINGGYLLITDRANMYQGATYLFDYTFKAGVEYEVKFDAKLSADGDVLRFYLLDGTSESAPEIKRHDNVSVNEGNNPISFKFTPAEDKSGKALLKFHSGASLTAYPEIQIDNFVITNNGDLPAYECNFDSAEDSNGWAAYTNVSYAPTRDLPTLTLEGIAPYVAGNGYVHVGNRESYVSGASYTSNVNLTAGETYTLTMRMRSSEADEYIRAFAGGAQTHVLLNGDWSTVSFGMTPAADQAFSLYFHGGYGDPAGTHHSFADFDIDSLVLTDSTGAELINETYDNGVGTWVEYASTSYNGFQGSTVSHGVEDDYATVPGSVATYTPAEQMKLKAGTYGVTGTFKVPYSRANLVVARTFDNNGNAGLAPTTLIADYNKINVGVEIEDAEGNIYYAEENSVPVTSEWTDVRFEVEIPTDVTVKRISFVGKDGVVPAAGTYAYGSETVTAGLLKDIFDDDTADDALANSPMLVEIVKQDGTYQNHTYMKSNYATIAAADGFLADAIIPFQFCNAEISMIKLMPTEATDASPVGILAMLLLRRKMDSNIGGEGEGDDVIDTPEVVEDKYYLHVETTEYPQGIEFITEDSAYLLDANKEYVLEIKMRSTADISYYRAYCAGGEPSKFSGTYEIKPEGWANSGFSVEGEWVVVSGNLVAGVEGQLGIKIHGGVNSGSTYGDSFDIDYIKVTEKGTDNVFFYEDFEDEEFNCTYNVINSAVGAAVKG